MSAVHLGPVEPLVFKPTVVQQRIISDWNKNQSSTYQRIVPPVVPSFDEPCPDCGTDDVPTFACWPCGGTGTVQRVWRAERQCLGHFSGEWRAPACGRPCHHQRRLAVVSWYPVTVLPVVDIEGDMPPRPHIVVGDEEEASWDPYNFAYIWDPWETTRTEVGPWAADLVPGCVVVIPGDEVRLATPITHELGNTSGRGSDGPDYSPLALTEGLNEVELVR